MKKLYPVLFTFAVLSVCILLLGTTADAANDENITFTLNSDGKSYCLTNCNYNVVGTLEIPSTYKGLPVTAIADYGLSGGESVTLVVIPDTVTYIGKDAFDGCYNLTAFFVSEENPKFSTDSNGVLFNKDKTELIYVPHINRPFTVPSTVSRMDVGAFRSLSFCSSYSIAEDNPYFHLSSDGVLFSKDKTVLIAMPKPFGNRNYTIPDSVTTIGEYAFEGLDFGTMTIPPSITKIGAWAFANTRIWTLVIDDLSKWCTINFDDSNSNPMYMFPFCSIATDGIKDGVLNIPNGVTKINNYAFYRNSFAINNSNVVNIAIPESVISIGDEAFYAWDKITVSGILKDVGKNAFGGCKGLTTICVENSIGAGAFQNCGGLSNVTLGPGIQKIEDYTFDGCTSLANIEIPNGVTAIGDYAFNGCHTLTSISLPDGLESIGSHAFDSCIGLSTVLVPNSLTSVGNNAFLNCYGLRYNEKDNSKYLGNQSNPYVILIEDNPSSNSEPTAAPTSNTIPTASETHLAILPTVQNPHNKATRPKNNYAEGNENSGTIIAFAATALLSAAAGSLVTCYILKKKRK